MIIFIDLHSVCFKLGRQINAKTYNLKSVLQICVNYQQIRADNGYWIQKEKYINEHSEVGFLHSLCPECMEEHYLDLT